eukprot:CAMPEP_0172501840 /NCGR_PEP_ID=MMETSP1066-20121228/154090_1 /TAXON_ID=671091 /ORGANISM="Coscinodiscus wailesii, Strain CCMP2513" /LENGTH=225 /DNA_ID=CAMNT_0013276855 /DNA_START=143 /DNA_END=820 /DNA_ORIENTATION=-
MTDPNRAIDSSSATKETVEDSTASTFRDTTALAKEAETSSLNLASITDGQNERGIPAVKFVEDIGALSESFSPPASAEILIGAFTDLFTKYKAYETNLSQKRLNFLQKIPEIEKSLAIVTTLKKKQDENETITTQYQLADVVYAKAEIECKGVVHLWLGANVMLEYTYDEAIELLKSKEEIAKRQFDEVNADLAFTRDQIITSEVNISRIYNWDLRRKRAAKTAS